MRLMTFYGDFIPDRKVIAYQISVITGKIKSIQNTPKNQQRPIYEIGNCVKDETRRTELPDLLLAAADLGDDYGDYFEESGQTVVTQESAATARQTKSLFAMVRKQLEKNTVAVLEGRMRPKPSVLKELLKVSKDSKPEPSNQRKSKASSRSGVLKEMIQVSKISKPEKLEEKTKESAFSGIREKKPKKVDTASKYPPGVNPLIVGAPEHKAREQLRYARWAIGQRVSKTVRHKPGKIRQINLTATLVANVAFCPQLGFQQRHLNDLQLEQQQIQLASLQLAILEQRLRNTQISENNLVVLDKKSDGCDSILTPSDMLNAWSRASQYSKDRDRRRGVLPISLLKRYSEPPVVMPRAPRVFISQMTRVVATPTYVCVDECGETMSAILLPYFEETTFCEAYARAAALAIMDDVSVVGLLLSDVFAVKPSGKIHHFSLEGITLQQIADSIEEDIEIAAMITKRQRPRVEMPEISQCFRCPYKIKCDVTVANEITDLCGERSV